MPHAISISIPNSQLHNVRTLFAIRYINSFVCVDIAIMTSKGRTQIPIVCPGHTRPLAELQYLHSERRGDLAALIREYVQAQRDFYTGQADAWAGALTFLDTMSL